MIGQARGETPQAGRREPLNESEHAARAGYPRCGLPRRLAAMAYDAVIVTGLLLIAAAAASPLDAGNQQALRDPAFTLYLLAVWFVYLALCWMRGGMTLGMRAWNVVLLADGGRPGWSRCAVRFAVSLLSAAALGAGFLWSLADPQRRCWHDIVSRTGLYRRVR